MGTQGKVYGIVGERWRMTTGIGVSCMMSRFKLSSVLNGAVTGAGLENKLNLSGGEFKARLCQTVSVQLSVAIGSLLTRWEDKSGMAEKEKKIRSNVHM